MSEAHGIPLTLRVLRKSPNRAAVDVLAASVQASEPELRCGAVRSLAERSETAAQAELLAALGEAPADARGESRARDVTKRMRKAVIAAVGSGDVTRTKQACRYAIDTDLYAALPAMVEQAMIADHPYVVGLSTATLRLCRSMAARLENPKAESTTDSEDPAFYRTATLQRLTEAAERFGEHRRLELIESLLLVTTRDNSQLLRLLRDEGHACHNALTQDLKVSPSFGAIDVLCHAVFDGGTPGRLLKIASERVDKPFVARLAEHVGYPIGLRARESAVHLERFAWMSEQSRGVLLELAPEGQAALTALAAATAASPAERLRFVRFVLEQGASAARTAACHLLRGFKSPEVVTLLGTAIKDETPSVVAAAARQLRSRGVPGAEVVLIDLLEHPADEVRRAAQDGLHELNLEHYRTLFERLSEPARRASGRLVARADPDAPQQLAAELQQPIVRQRMESLAIIDAMGLVDQLAEPLSAALADNDIAVRSEAARLLGTAATPNDSVLAALATATEDSNLAVRTAAEKSLDGLRSLDTAAGLVDQLQREFEDTGDEP